MSNGNHEDWAGYAASFALGALDDDERAGFEAHLASCTECQAEVESYRDVAAGLAGTLVQREPPASLRARILEDARTVKPITPAAVAAPSPKPGTGGGTAGPRRSPRDNPRRWLIAASIGIALIAAASWYSERDARHDAEQTMQAMTEAARADGARIAELEEAIAQRDSLLGAVLAPDIATARLTAQGRPPSARVFWSRQQGRVVFAAWDLDPAPAGRTYQLWAIAAGGAPVSLGTFDTDATGTTRVALPVDASLQIDVAAVTEEPAGGSPQPTTQPFLVGNVAAQ